MINLKNVLKKIRPIDHWMDFANQTPTKWIQFENFLPKGQFQQLCQEIDSIPQASWGEFTRNNSYMKECKDPSDNQFINHFAMQFNSSIFIKWLQELTSEEKLIPDPHYIGSGIMRSFKNHSLKMHTDFNWNEELQLNRRVNVIYYCSKTWQDDWGGHFHMQMAQDDNSLKIVKHKPNSLLIWIYDENLWHGHPEPLSCPTECSRDGMRFYYYQSNSTPWQTPHRSLYYQDEHGNPIDKKD